MMLQKIQQPIGLTAARTEVDVRDEQRTEPPFGVGFVVMVVLG
jgi:hypothetical protein